MTSVKQYRLSHDRCKADPSVDRNTRLHEAKTDMPAGNENPAQPLMLFHVHEHLQALMSARCHHFMIEFIDQDKDGAVASP